MGASSIAASLYTKGPPDTTSRTYPSLGLAERSSSYPAVGISDVGSATRCELPLAPTTLTPTPIQATPSVAATQSLQVAATKPSLHEPGEWSPPSPAKRDLEA